MTGEAEVAVDVTEMGRLLGCSADTIYSMVRSGDIPGFRLGLRAPSEKKLDRRPWRFFPSEVKAALAPSADLWAQPARARRRNVA